MMGRSWFLCGDALAAGAELAKVLDNIHSEPDKPVPGHLQGALAHEVAAQGV